VTTDHGLEPIDVTVRSRTGRCPSCGHEAAVRVGGSLSLHRLMGLPVRPARCGHRDVDDHGSQSLGDWPCVCDHAFHGS
jgi:hypothetical protein